LAQDGVAADEPPITAADANAALVQNAAALIDAARHRQSQLARLPRGRRGQNLQIPADCGRLGTAGISFGERCGQPLDLNQGLTMCSESNLPPAIEKIGRLAPHDLSPEFRRRSRQMPRRLRRLRTSSVKGRGDFLSGFSWHNLLSIDFK
jgi:hypothetical protein